MTIPSSTPVPNPLLARLFPRNSRLRTWWRNLRIGVKLRLSLLIVLVVAFTVVILVAQNVYAGLTLLNIDRAQTQQVESIAQNVRRVLDSTFSVAKTVTSQEVETGSGTFADYLQSLDVNYNPTSETSGILSQLAGEINQQMVVRSNIESIRFDLPNGQQAFRVERSLSSNVLMNMTGAQLGSDKSLLGFTNLSRLPPSQAYLIAVQPRPVLTVGGTNTMALLVAVPIQRNNQFVGVFLISFPETNPLNDFIGAQSSGVSYIVQDDTNGNMLVNALSAGIYVFDGKPYALPLTETIAPLSVEDRASILKSAHGITLNVDQIVTSHILIPVPAAFGTNYWHVIVSQPLGLAELTPVSSLIPFIAIFIVLVLATLVIERVVTGPLNALAGAAGRIRGGDFSVRVTQSGKDEIGQLGEALNTMSEQVSALLGEMESRVIERTRDIEVVAEISRDVAAARDIDALLSNVVEQLRERFGFYHVQVFLVDDSGENAILRSSTGTAGRTLLERQHRLRVGSESIVGQATATGRATVTEDTDRSQVAHFRNPLLPETRSEMALPIRTGRTVIGALDVQSRYENAFDEDDIRIFQVLADQLAFSIQNARLIESNQYEAQRAQTLLNESTTNSWREYLGQQGDKPMAYRYDLMKVTPVDPAQDPRQKKQGSTGRLNSLQSPITVRGVNIGDLNAIGGPGDLLTSDDRLLVDAVAERVALAIENVRLSQQTLTAYGEVQRLYEINRNMSSAPNVQTIYRLIAEQLEQEPLVERMNILAADPVADRSPQGFTYVLRWDRYRKVTSALDTMPGARVSLRDLSFLDVTQPGKPYQIDLSTSFNPLVTTSVVSQQGIQSMIVAPITIAGRWFGLMVIQSRQAQAFNDRFLQFITALTDQAAVALENRYLFDQTEAGRATLQSVLEALPVGIFVVEMPARQIVLFNSRALEYMGKSRTRAILSMNDVREYIPTIDLALTTGDESLTFEPPVEDPEQRTMRVETSSVQDATGKLMSLIVVINDITDLQIAQDAVETELIGAREMSDFGQIVSAQSDLRPLLIAIGQQLYRLEDLEIMFFVWQSEKQGITEGYSLRANTDVLVPLTNTYGVKLPFPTEILDERGPQMIHNAILTDPTMRIASLVSFPLRTGGRVTGWLLLGSSQMTYRYEDDRLLPTVIDRLAVSAEAIRLQRQTQTALRETERLYLASRAISGSLSTEETAHALRDQVRTLSPDRVDVFLLNAHTDEEVRWFEHWTAEGIPAIPETDRAKLLFSTDLLALPPTVIQDASQSPADEQAIIADIPGLHEFGALIHFPIQVKNFIIGRLVLGFRAPRLFTQEDLRYIETLSEQTATVVDNALLYQESQQALEETSTLYQAGRAIVNAEDDRLILPAIADYAFPAIITHAMLFRFLGSADHAAEGTLLVVSDWVRNSDDSNMSGMQFNPDEFSLYNLLNTLDVRYIEDVEESDAVDEDTRLICLSLDLKSLVVVPLAISGRAIGALLIGSKEHYVYTSRELRMYSSLADQTAVTLDNRSLLRQTEARARQIQTSSEVGRATTSILNLNELLQQTVYLIQNSFGYDHVQIFLVSPDGKDARLQASTGEAGRKLLDNKHSLQVGSASVIGRVTASGQLYNVQDTLDPNSTHRPNPFLPNTRSELALPLTARGHVIGALDVQSNEARAFAPDDEQILSTLSDQIAIAIDNASLFGENEQRINEVRFLFNATRAAVNAETDIAFSRVTRQILENTTSDLVVLFTPESTPDRYHITYAAREGLRYVLPSGIPANFGLLGELAQTQQPIIRGDHSLGKLFSADDVPDVRALALIPLTTGEDLLGALAVFSVQPDVFTPALVQLLQTLVSSLSAIVQNSQLFRELQDANIRLREVDQLKSQFLANMSHELRTPLNSIIGFSRVILKGLDGPLNETQEQDLNTVFESGKHLLNLVNAILDQAKIEAGKMEVESVFFDINTSIKTSMSTAIGLVKDKPIRLHQEIQADLPEVYGDETRVTQIMLNMLSNAAKFTRQGSITMSAFTVMENDHKMVQVSVADTGIGIPTESLDRVFAAFEQVDNSVTRGAEGTGLGMPIARALVEMMGGRIWVESTPGAGSTFSFVLPTESSVPPEADETDQANGAESLSPELADQVEQALSESDAKNMDFEHRIIVALDDEPGMFNLFRRYLTKSGYEVIGTTKPDELVELVMTYQPRAVLLDINMPNRSGWDILQLLKSRPETFDYPVIMCSIEDDKVRGARLGASGYLVKPFLEEDLYDVLKRIELEREWPLVLLIDDQAESLRLMRDSLSIPDLNVRILEAADGDQGLTMIGSQHPAVVIMDVRMPDPDGFAIIEKLRSNPATADLPVLLITAAELSETERARLLNERVEYKGKLTGDDLVRYVRQQVARG